MYEGSTAGTRGIHGSWIYDGVARRRGLHEGDGVARRRRWQAGRQTWVEWRYGVYTGYMIKKTNTLAVLRAHETRYIAEGLPDGYRGYLVKCFSLCGAIIIDQRSLIISKIQIWKTHTNHCNSKHEEGYYCKWCCNEECVEVR